ncbi:DUF4956 domain-containing protein [Streptomyces sp. HNM0575]|uniref:DUF4956 domain-containing protein n=1 Tax=Streptomyces sp. HNM0575 TaxID=2716338 RepID=UPI00145F0ACF|nr:DUF4956 domain-containing protein [Streptomyces sp. HNM0575]NLU76315.1 DUF4956 domain-containing protein [Streptomyces sp. HNM0575]
MDLISEILAHFILDFAAVCVLTFAVYYPRHRRRDLIPGYLAMNVSLFALAAALGRSGDKGGIALGFGLIGVLSIVGLRSESMQSEEVAYYFTTLVLGLISGLPNVSLPLAGLLCALPLAVVYVAGHPRLFARTQRALVTIDAAVTEPDAIEAFVRDRLGEPLSWKIQEVDYGRNLTVVDVRYRGSRGGGAGRARRILRIVRPPRLKRTARNGRARAADGRTTLFSDKP